MIIKHFDVITPETHLPRDEGWEQNWAGYYAMTKCLAQQRKERLEERDNAIREEGQMTQTGFGKDCLLSVLADIQKPHVNMFELGAGWGRMCLETAGVIDYRLIPVTPVSYRCLAVEGEPTHYQWAKEHFDIQNINGAVVLGAVSNKNGSCWFNTGPSPDSCYGQAMESFVSRRKLPKIKNLYNIIKKGIIKIPMYTVDHLIQRYSFDHVDFVHMDVQGAEYKVILGAAESIKNDLIDHLWIGTHHNEMNDELRRLLSPKFDLIIDIYPRSIGKVDGFTPVRCHDGIQIYKRKNI